MPPGGARPGGGAAKPRSNVVPELLLAPFFDDNVVPELSLWQQRRDDVAVHHPRSGTYVSHKWHRSWRRRRGGWPTYEG